MNTALGLKQSVAVDGVNLAFLTAGTGDAVLFVHGWPTYSHLWRLQVPALADAFSVYAPDLPGFGDSDKPADVLYTLDFLVGTLTGFLDALELPEVRIVCHDLGGPISLLFAAQQPERVAQLVIMDTIPYPEMPLMMRLMLPLARLPGFGNAMVSRRGLRLALQLGTVRDGVVTDDLVAAYDRPYVQDPEARRLLLRILTGLDVEQLGEVAANLSSISAPTLILWAENDPSAPLSIAHRLQADIRSAELKTIPECGHFLTEDQPDAVNELLLGFLE
jgi:pimeloyl-ACP methyl ester carboxylesterase